MNETSPRVPSKSRVAATMLAGAMMFSGGCAAEVGEDGEPSVLAAPIVAEVPGQAERVYSVYGVDAARTLRSYAAVSSDSCSGTMIGPNIMLTAAHCVAENPKRAVFRVYVDATTQRTEFSACDYLIHGWPEHDLVLYWCRPDASGINPGDRWGYVDLDVDVSPAGQLLTGDSSARVAEGRAVYSIWSNPITSLDANQHHLISSGAITATNGGGDWFNPGGNPCSDTDDVRIAVYSDTYGARGASGSSQLSAETHRLLLGPLSTVSVPEGGRGRQSAAIIDVLLRGVLTTDNRTGRCADRGGPQVNGVMLRELWDDGIRFDPDPDSEEQYYGSVDADRNGIFDVQQDLERSAGEARRAFYDLSFSSVRRNALWTRGPNTAIVVQPQAGYAEAILDGSRGEWFSILTHERLNLDPARRYRVRYRVTSSTAASLVVCGQDCTTHHLNADHDEVFVDPLTPGASLQFYARGGTRLTLRDITISEIGTVIDFESADERAIWRRSTAESASPSFIVPNGRRSDTRVDFAGWVRHRTWPIPYVERLVTTRLTTPPGQVRVCFHHRANTTATGWQGTIALGSVSGSTRTFSPESGWQQTCTDWVEANRGASSLAFGATGSRASYFIDDVDVQHRASPVPEGSVALVGLASKCMDVRGGSTAPGTPVQLFDCNGTAAQRWLLTASGEVRGWGGHCLDVPNGQAVNGTQLWMLPCNGSAAQRFERTAAGELRSALDRRMCVEVRGGFSANGTAVQTYECNSTASQWWREE